MRALVIGFGSIGVRHSKILNELGCEVRLVSKRKSKTYFCYDNFAKANLDYKPEYIIVSNSTDKHYNTYLNIKNSEYDGLTLIEKPIFSKIPKKFNFSATSTFVAYNLRFHPHIQRLTKDLRNETIISINAYVGQYLPNWRKNRDYTSVYSALKQKGGGVLRDLSHEIDYVALISGKWKRLAALGGNYSNLKINSDDIFSILYEAEHCPVCSISINYLDRYVRRSLIVNTNNFVFEIDFINNIYKKNNKEIKIDIDSNFTYKEMHKELISGTYKNACTFSEGLKVVNTIEAAEKSSLSKSKWIINEKNM